MISPFGVDHGGVSKRDYTKAQEKWERAAQRANVAETIGQTAGGGAGAVIGAATLRDAMFTQKPHLKRKAAKRAKNAKLRFIPVAVHGHPGYKTLGVAIGGGMLAGAAGHSRKLAEHQARKYERMNLAKNEPGSLMHQHDLEISKKLFQIESDDQNLKQHKKIQGMLGGAAATTGLAALTTKTGSQLLPKMSRGGKAGAAYQKHLDRTANALLFAGAGLGGASGLHQSAIYAAEGRKKIEKRNYDPERRRQQREVAYTAGLGAGSAYSAVSAAKTSVQRRKGFKAQSRFNERADYYRDKAGQQKQARKDYFYDRADRSEGKAVRRQDAATAMAREAQNLSRQAEPGPNRKRPNYRRRAVASQMADRARQAYREGQTAHRVASRLRGIGDNDTHSAASASSQRVSDRLRAMANDTKIPKRPVKAALAAGALAGGAVAMDQHRRHGGQPYKHWMDGARPAKQKKQKRYGPLGQSRIKRKYKQITEPDYDLPTFLKPDEQTELAATLERQRRRAS